MTVMQHVARFIPGTRETLLLRAALGDGKDAVSAWEHWRRAIAVEALDGESHRLLPLLHHNLQRLGVTDPVLIRYRSVRKQSWYRNRVLFHGLSKVFRTLADQGIEVLALKGAVLAHSYYPEPALRPMADLDVLIRGDRLEQAVGVLLQAGFQADGWSPRRRFALPAARLYHGCGFKGRGPEILDLHWHASADGCFVDADRGLWQRALPFSIEGVGMRALGPSDLVLHTLAHAYASHVPVIRWLADAVMVMRTAPSRIDWDQLLDEAERRRLVLPVRTALAYLERSGLASVPRAVLAELERVRPSLMEQAEFVHRSASEPYSMANRAARLWFWNWRLGDHPPLAVAAARLPGFLLRYATH